MQAQPRWRLRSRTPTTRDARRWLTSWPPSPAAHAGEQTPPVVPVNHRRPAPHHPDQVLLLAGFNLIYVLALIAITILPAVGGTRWQTLG